MEELQLLFFEMRATCSGCTGLLVFDSTGCVPEWCATSVQMIEYAPNIHVYPNPFSSVVSVGSDVPIAAVKIFDYSGVLLHQSNNTKNITVVR